MHDHKWSLSNISYKSRDLGHKSIEEFSLQLDGYLSNNKNMSKEQEDMIQKTIELLHSLVADEPDGLLYEKGYEEGYEDAKHEIRSMI